MRNPVFIYFILISCLAFISSCEEDNILDPNSYNQEFLVKNGEKINFNVQPNSDDLEINILNIEDSRCPTDLICIWYGYARVEFSFGGSDYFLCLGQCDREFNHTDEVTITTPRGEIKVILLEVTPYPGTGDEPKGAKLLITQV